MEYNEADYLQLSGIQHFRFCRRQWALIHIENQWAENSRTVGGEIMHERAHDSELRERRGDLLITRNMPVASPTLGVSGACDVVEFRPRRNALLRHSLWGALFRGDPQEGRGEFYAGAAARGAGLSAGDAGAFSAWIYPKSEAYESV